MTDCDFHDDFSCRAEFEEGIQVFIHIATMSHLSGIDVTRHNYINETKTIFKDGNWSYCNMEYGSNPMVSTIDVRYASKPCFFMYCKGNFFGSKENLLQVTACLTEAFLHNDINHPWRGPACYIDKNGLIYTNIWDGCIDEFAGEECVANNDGEFLFRGTYSGLIIC